MPSAICASGMAWILRLRHAAQRCPGRISPRSRVIRKPLSEVPRCTIQILHAPRVLQRFVNDHGPMGDRNRAQRSVPSFCLSVRRPGVLRSPRNDAGAGGGVCQRRLHGAGSDPLRWHIGSDGVAPNSLGRAAALSAGAARIAFRLDPEDAESAEGRSREELRLRVGRDIQAISGMAGSTQPKPATT